MANIPTVAGAGVAGALAGGIFPIFLFKDFGIPDLIKGAASTTAAAPFAITIFVMLALVIIGIGALLSTTDISANRIVTFMLYGFGSVFVIGFVATIGFSVYEPRVHVVMDYSGYAQDSDFLKKLKLAPYVDDNETPGVHASLAPSATIMCRGVVPIEVGITGIREALAQAHANEHEVDTTCFPPETIGVICALDGLKATKSCVKYTQTHQQPQISTDGG